MDVSGGTIIDLDSETAREQWMLTVINPGGGYAMLPCIGITDQSEEGRVVLSLHFDSYENETGTTAALSFVPADGTITGPTGGPCSGIGVQQLPVSAGAIVAVFSDQF